MAYWHWKTASPGAVKLAAGQRTTLFIPVRALDGFGEGEISAQISGLTLPGETFAPQQKQWKLGVRPAFAAQTVNSGAMLNPGESWHAPCAAPCRNVPDNAARSCTVQRQTPVEPCALYSGTESLPVRVPRNKPPAACSRRCTPTPHSLKRWASKASDEQRRAAVDLGISRLLQMQRDDGGFSLWDKSGSEEYWLTAYVTDFLGQRLRSGLQRTDKCAE